MIRCYSFSLGLTTIVMIHSAHVMSKPQSKIMVWLIYEPYALREKANLPSVKYFVECWISGTRQTIICRVFALQALGK